jgi:hypothetical protein
MHTRACVRVSHTRACVSDDTCCCACAPDMRCPPASHMPLSPPRSATVQPRQRHADTRARRARITARWSSALLREQYITLSPAVWSPQLFVPKDRRNAGMAVIGKQRKSHAQTCTQGAVTLRPVTSCSRSTSPRRHLMPHAQPSTLRQSALPHASTLWVARGLLRTTTPPHGTPARSLAHPPT